MLLAASLSRSIHVVPLFDCCLEKKKYLSGLSQLRRVVAVNEDGTQCRDRFGADGNATEACHASRCS